MLGKIKEKFYTAAIKGGYKSKTGFNLLQATFIADYSKDELKFKFVDDKPRTNEGTQKLSEDNDVDIIFQSIKDKLNFTDEKINLVFLKIDFEIGETETKVYFEKDGKKLQTGYIINNK
jgi:hypothetical protein